MNDKMVDDPVLQSPLSPGKRKKSLSRFAKALRIILSTLDPRAFVHMLRIASYYNTHHVRPLRQVRLGTSPAISPDVIFSNPERISIGNRAHIGSRTHLWAGPSHGRIIIGNDVLIGPDVMLTAANYRFNDGTPVTEQIMDEGNISIGDDVWLGAKVVVLPGVTIGDGAVIGASAVVTKNVGAYEIAVGIPARVVGKRKRT